MHFKTLPMALSFFRFAFGTFAMPYMIIKAHYTPSFLFICVILYIGTALTDLLDGMCARLYNQASASGGVIDLIADKSFLFALLIALSSINRVHILISLIFIARECAVLGLRMILLIHQKPLPIVAKSAKLKTVFQHCFFLILILKNLIIHYLGIDCYFALYGFFLAGSMYCALFSAVNYYIYSKHFFEERPLS